MSIFGALNTAFSGIRAQSRALANIADNIANAQTVGYKRVDTSFLSLVQEAGGGTGGVIARPSYTNDIQGTALQTGRATDLLLQGAGFFSVSQLTTGPDGRAVASPERFYTRDGSFDLNAQRYLVNDAGFVLNGYAVDPATGQAAATASPIRVTSTLDAPIATGSITLRANLPEDPSQPVSPIVVPITDAEGNARTIVLNWQPGDSADSWRLVIDTPDAVGSRPLGDSLPGHPASAAATGAVAGTRARAQVETVTLTGPGIKVGDSYSVTVDGAVYAAAITQANAAQVQDLAGVAQMLADRINGAVPAAGVLARVVNGGLQLTATVPGTPFTASAGVVNGTSSTTVVGGPVTTAATATTGEIQRFGFAGTGIDIGDSFTVDPGTGVLLSLTVTAGNIASLRDMAGVTQALAALINNQPGAVASATASGGNLTLASLTPGVPFLPPPTVWADDGGTVPSAAAAVTTIGTIAGSRQVQRVSLGGVAGDVGTTYSVQVRSPMPVGPQAAGIIQVQVPSDTQPDIREFSFGPAGTATQVGEKYAVTVDGTDYALLITEGNIAQFPTRGNVAFELNSRINDDPLGPVTAAMPNNPPPAASPSPDTVIQVTGRRIGQALDVAQPAPAGFDRTVTYTTTGAETSLDEIAGLLAAKVNAETGLPVTASAAGGVLTLTGINDGVTFLTAPAATAGRTPAHIGLTFGGTLPDGSAGTAGALTAIGLSAVGSGNATAAALRDPRSPARITFQVDYGSGPQTITLDLGRFDSTAGLTQFSGDDVNVVSLIQDGSPQGSFQDVEITGAGEVVATFDNGRRTTIAVIPVVQFDDPNALARANGNVLTETAASGTPRYGAVGLNGAGSLVTGSLEGSNVDIADEFTKLILAQRIYSANTRVITVADELLVETLNMKR